MKNEKDLVTLAKPVACLLYEREKKRDQMLHSSEAAASMITGIDEAEIYALGTEILQVVLDGSDCEDPDAAQIFLFECLTGGHGCDTAEKFWETCFNEDGTLRT